MKKKLLAALAAAFVLIVLFRCLDFQSVEDYYGGKEKQNGSTQKVYITIKCNTILDNYDKLDVNLRSEQYVPKDGIILKRTGFALQKGDTVFDILERAAKKNKLQLDYSGADEGSYKTVYVKGINHLYELSCGELSGWMFTVNGRIMDNGASAVSLKDGDEIEWVYTCDLGRDIGADTKGGTQN